MTVPLAREPAVLLLDEPFSAVDRRTRRRLQAELQELRSAMQVPIVLVTHDLDEAAALADRGANAAAHDAGYRVSQRRIVLGIYTDGGRLPQRPRRNRLTRRCACLSGASVAAG